MNSLEEFNQLEKNIQDELIRLRAKFEDMLAENQRLKKEIAKLKGTTGGAKDFAIEVGEGGIKEDKKTKKSVDPGYNIPSTDSSSEDKTVKPSEKFSTKNLDELIDTDPLSRSVYQRLKPLGAIKQRVLAMQMGISQEKCQIAIDRLIAAGGVKKESKGMVKVIDEK